MHIQHLTTPVTTSQLKLRYREIAKAVKFLIFATILRESYDKERKTFLSLDRLSFKKIKLIGMATERIVADSLSQKEKVNISTFWGSTKEKQKAQRWKLFTTQF